MKQRDAFKIAVGVIVLIFFIQMFSWFGTARQGTQEESKNKTILTASGTIKGVVQSYSRELTVEPWGNLSDAVKQLQSEGKIEYVNVLGSRGVVFLTKGTDISEIRSAIVARANVSVFADATVVFDKVVNLTLQNGTVETFSLVQMRVSLDPITQPGDELYFDIIADVTETTLVNVIANPIPVESIFTASGSMECTNEYGLTGYVKWDNRELNTSEVADALNISAALVKYSPDNAVKFIKAMNETELASISEKNLSYISNLQSVGFVTNLTDSDAITNDLAFLGYPLAFSPSQLSVVFGSTDLNATLNSLDALGKLQDITAFRKCNIIITNVTSNDDKPYAIFPQKGSVVQFVSPEKASDTPINVTALIKVKRIGRTITEISEAGIK
jgi:hypothetical protein